MIRATLSTTVTRFKQVVGAKLIENKLARRKPDSVRSLARAMGEGDAIRADSFKRSLMKWMSPNGPKPSAASRALVARHLGIAASELDDEEADPVADLFNALGRYVDARVRTARP